MRYDAGNVLIVADTHIPFQHRGYLDFCLDVQRRVKCGIVVHIGDLVDNHAISYHEHHPDGYSPADEMTKADAVLRDWFKAFPHVYLCRGNHDQLHSRKAKTAGLPSRVFQQFRDIWDLPSGWKDDFSHTIYGVHYSHGTPYSGLYGHARARDNHRQSSVIGHLHSVAGIEWSANDKDCIFGMCVGWGGHRKSYAFDYGKDFRTKPIVSCGVVTDRGKYPQIFTMDL